MDSKQGRWSPQSTGQASGSWCQGRSAWHQSSTLVCGARLSQQWSGACLSYTSKVVYSTLLGLFDKCPGTPDAKWGICPGAYVYGWFRSADTTALTTCSDVLSVSPKQMCLLWPCGQMCLPARCVYSDLGNFPLGWKCPSWLAGILVDVSDSTLFYTLYATLVGPMPLYWSYSPH